MVPVVLSQRQFVMCALHTAGFTRPQVCTLLGIREGTFRAYMRTVLTRYRTVGVPVHGRLQLLRALLEYPPIVERGDGTRVRIRPVRSEGLRWRYPQSDGVADVAS